MAVLNYACPTPPAPSLTSFPGSFTATPSELRRCEVGTSVVIPPAPAPGPSPTPTPPPAPPPCTFLRYEGDWVNGRNYFRNGLDATAGCTVTSIVTRDDGIYLCKTTHTSDDGNSPSDGLDWETWWVPFGEYHRMRWKRTWASGTEYMKDDVVFNPRTRLSYVALQNHTAGTASEPGEGSDWTTNWDALGAPNPPDEGVDGIVNDLLDNVLGWVKNASIGDWLLALAAGAGLIWAGTKILDALNPDNANPPGTNPDARFDGTPTYNGPFTPPNLPVFVASLMEFAGVDYDVSLLPNQPVSLAITSDMTVRKVLGDLAIIYQFDIVDSGNLVKFIPKFLPSARTLTEEDMGFELNDEGAIPYAAKRIQGIDLPRSITLSYYNKNLAYNKMTQSSSLSDFADGQDIAIEVPLVLEDSVAKQLTETVLANAHIEQQQFVFTTDYNHIDLEPADVITLNLDNGLSIDCRVIQIAEQDDGVIELTVSRADFNTITYTTPNSPATSAPTQNAQVVRPIGFSGGFFLEVQHLDDSETLPRLKLAVHGFGVEGWRGCIVYRSVDGGASYTPVETATVPSKIGVARSTASLNAPVRYQTWDRNSTVDVEVQNGTTLLSRSEIAVLNGENWCMIGQEIIGFTTATLIGPNTYRLSNLLRGRQGTEQFCSTHQPNEIFVVLDNSLLSIPLQWGDLGKPQRFKIVTIGSDISLVDPIDITPYGENFRPWAPAHLKAVRQPNGDWVISWVGRVKVDNELKDYTEVEYGPDFGGFGLAIFTPGFVDIKRREGLFGSSYTYTAANQTADFGAPQTSLSISVTEVSKRVGGGYPSKLVV